MSKSPLILLADDDEDDVLLLKMAIRELRQPVDVFVVSDGERAVSYLAGEGEYRDREEFPLPSLVLLDLNMPCRNGFEVLEWARSQEGLKRLPIVVLSSSTQGPHINRSYELGANSYVVKASKFDELVERLRILCEYWLRYNETSSMPRMDPAPRFLPC